MNHLDPVRPRADLDVALDIARGAASAAFVHLDAPGAQVAANEAAQRQQEGRPLGLLDGRIVSIKDLFDVAGQVTTAGSTVLADRPAAAADAPVVARLRAAGAVLIGRTQMTEFAFSGVGINPHHGTPVNPVMAAVDPVPRAPGGSTSGGAVSVATGAAWAALGSDTGGSIRIPAALHGLVGFKNTQSRTPNAGSVPLSPSLDTSCAITRTVQDAVAVHAVLSARPCQPERRRLSDWHFGVVEPLLLDQMDPVVARDFERALAHLSCLGARITRVTLPALSDLPALQQDGGLPAAESWAWHQTLLAERGDQYDPRVAARIRRGATITPAALARLHDLRARWIARMVTELADVDFVLSPTVPLIAPPLAPLVADEVEFFRVNALLLRNPAVVNLLDGCAISLPCHRMGEAPVGLMAWTTGGRDDALLGAALAMEDALAPLRGVAAR
ncbi:amidase [Sphaerotilus sp.]|uniref:amidase n=1 Tax=Sphaerotilus sp. TaxID=2093942 RepID=UPI002ACE1A54|nr:amidase [Sphaerotilus sp.]MDZ7858506.1 amidase [Sphaerotilus sp.]